MTINKQVTPNPHGWEYPISYQDMLDLRIAYNAGAKTAETRLACRVYMHYRRQKQQQTNGQEPVFKFIRTYKPRKHYMNQEDRYDWAS